MAPGPCAAFHPDLSAYADGTLPPKRWEQVSYHLAGCEACRDEVAAISALCSTLSSCRRSAAPESLAARLEAIAGEHSASPLYMAAGQGELPSARQRRVRRAAQGGAVLLAVMVTTVVLAALVAPAPLVVKDPVKQARESFSRSLTAISVNEAVGAMLLANERGADFGASESYEPRVSETRSLPISAREASALLKRAADADLKLTGLQRVWASAGDGRYRTAEVRTTKVAGEGTNFEVFDARGELFSSTFRPDLGARTVNAPQNWTYLRSATTEQLVGRDATRVQAMSAGQVVAKWWLDQDSGLLLWAERYDELGRVNIAFGYKQLTLDSAALDPTSAQPVGLRPASSSGAKGWCVGLGDCPQSLAGMALVAYASSHETMNLVYSDGFHTAVVDWSKGVLPGGTTRASDRGTEMSVDVWQAGEAVISVACDCTPARMAQLHEGLPGELAYEPTLGSRILDGLARLTRVG